ncbi:MAG: hypothetical protein DRM98_04785 [Thermoplasmata archaeon]|nr:MAG: hypothetical protein DRM98_04785 [Thermoplasmata archaeon]RLF49994.1 MAG: hypothetical protein DRN24_07265 [Thermoplasmata archaeon]
MKKTLKKTIKTLVFFIFTLLPFIYATHTIGINLFLDSFEKPDCYLYLQNNGNYLIIQKASHPDFSLKKGDIILFWENGDINYDKINQVTGIGTWKKYYIQDKNNSSLGEKPIYRGQIIGKIIKITNSNLYTEVSMKIWEVAIHNLNIKTLM